MAEFFHAGRTNTDDCYDAGKHVHGGRRVYGHDDDAGRGGRLDDCYTNGGQVGALAAGGASAALKAEQKEETAAKERSRAHDDHFCHHY